jgi:Uma2 family endonuclease
LVVEVSDTTLGFDRLRKKRVYARNAIPEYWILDLQAHCLEVYRDPVGEDYCSKTTLNADGEIAPVVLPDTEVLVADLLP